MRFRLKTLLLILVLFGGVCALFLATKRGSDAYQGYFSKTYSFNRLISQSDDTVRVEGSGGGGGGGTATPFITRFTHQLGGSKPFTEDLLNAMRRRIQEDLRSEGIKIIEIRDVPGADSNYPTAGIRLITWGFQVLFDDHGWKGLVTYRLTSREIRELEKQGPRAELFENIVVFPRD